jgi:hypothetical protein
MSTVIERERPSPLQPAIPAFTIPAPTTPSPTVPSAAAFLAAANAQPADRIVIAGATQLELLIVLTRSGFLDVTCRSPKATPHIPNSEADLLLAPALRDEVALSALLRGLGAMLRPGGTLIFSLTQPTGPAARAKLGAVLAVFGFGKLASVPGTSGETALWRARKHAVALRRVA